MGSLEGGEVGGIGKEARVSAAQLHLHGGVHHTRGQCAHFGPVGFEGFFQSEAARPVVHTGFGSTVGRLRCHGPPP